MTADKRDEQLQSYLKDEFQDTSLVEVVATILKAEPEKVFRLPDVVSAILSDDISKAQALKLRNRVGNILAVGARNGDWHRSPRGGGYVFNRQETSLSEESKQELALQIASGPMNAEQFTKLYARLREESPTERLNFSGINLKGVSFEECGEYQLYFQLSNLIFQNADLSDTDGDHLTIENCDFTGANLSGIDLFQSSFVNCDLTNANLSYARLSEVGFENTKLHNTNFSHAQLDDVYLPSGENLGPIDLSYAFVLALCEVDVSSEQTIKLYKTLYLFRHAGWLKSLKDADKAIELQPGIDLRDMYLGFAEKAQAYCSARLSIY